MNKINFNFNAQAHLIAGNNNDLTDYTNIILQSAFCKKNNCNICIACLQVRQNSHPNFIWLKPEKQYTLDQLDIVFKTISLNLNINEVFFIIFNNADALTQACSNKLLKSIEEPPKGYYFIFLTNRKDSILPTIRSRCVITLLNTNKSNLSHESEAISNLSNFFININLANPVNFLKLIDKININERECMDFVDFLICEWAGKCKTNLLEKNEKAYEHSLKVFNILNNSLQNSPMPGSSKIFLKNLFINVQNIN